VTLERRCQTLLHNFLVCADGGHKCDDDVGARRLSAVKRPHMSMYSRRVVMRLFF
jgi:hypothetical protein